MIQRNPLQPREKTLDHPELSEVLKRRDERLLHDIFGLRVVGDLADNEIIECALIALYECAKRLSVSRPHSGDDIRVFHCDLS
jgi:hypothetical protein